MDGCSLNPPRALSRSDALLPAGLPALVFRDRCLCVEDSHMLLNERIDTSRFGD